MNALIISLKRTLKTVPSHRAKEIAQHQQLNSLVALKRTTKRTRATTAHPVRYRGLLIVLRDADTADAQHARASFSRRNQHRAWMDTENLHPSSISTIDGLWFVTDPMGTTRRAKVSNTSVGA